MLVSLLNKRQIVSKIRTIQRNYHFSSSQFVIKPFLLADIGEGIAEVELMTWYIQKGDKIKAFERICEVQSDKATVEITSRFDGIVTNIHHKEGDVVKVGSALIDIDVQDTKTTSSTQKSTSTPPSKATPPKQSPPPTVAAPPAASTAAGGQVASKPFLLADIGEGIAEVELMNWYVKVGDVVKAFDRICEVQSDKATVEITSRYDGVVTTVHHKVGDVVKVHSSSSPLLSLLFSPSHTHLMMVSGWISFS